jgi:glyoxylase-like metal-dependent hydrolase (beta-lactamase superfamily II)
MELQTFKVGRLQTNCYLLVSENSNQCLIVDPGDSAELISSEILRQNLEPQTIIATHGHYDHIMAAQELQVAFDIPFMVHQQDEFLVNELQNRAKHWIQREIVEQPPELSAYLEDEQLIQLGQEQIKVIHTPGHTPGGVCFQETDGRILLTGDTIFSDGVGRTDLSYSSSADLKKSVKKIRQEYEDCHAYPGHGDDFWI